MKSSVTIITPSLNQGRFIERTIQSVLQQNFPGLKHIIFDGGSQDETLSILERYENNVMWFSEKDTGQSNAINKGFAKTTDDIIGWLNSDDVYYPGTIQRVVEFFEQNPEVDVVYGDANHIDVNDNFLSRYPTEDWNLQRLKKTCFISQPAVFFRRKVILENGLLDESLHYCMDYEYWLRLGLKGVRFCYLNSILAGSRLYPETKTLRAPSACYEEVIQMLNQKLGYVPLFWLLNYSIQKLHQNTSLQYPETKFIISALLKTSHSSLQFNGFLKGLMINLSLPYTVFELVKLKKIAKSI